MYDNIIKRLDNKVNKRESGIKIINHYVDGAYLEILSELDKNFKVDISSLT